MFNQQVKQSTRLGVSLVEMMMALLIAAVIMIAVYKTMQLQWRGLSQSTEEAKIGAEAKRVLEQLSRNLRNSGYNPRNTVYDFKDLSRRIGIMAAYPEAVVFSADLVGSTSEAPDGIINSAATLDKQLMPVEGNTDAREIQAIRLHGKKLELFMRVGNQSHWQLMSQGVERFLITYYDDSGRAIPFSLANSSTNGATLSKIHRLDLLLKLSDQFQNQLLTAESTTTVQLRNPPFLTPSKSQ